MQTLKIYLASILLFIVLSYIGIIISFKIGSRLVELQTSGTLISWKLLDGPYKFKGIVDANSSTVWAKTADGKLYSWNCQSQDECKWVEVENVPAEAHENDQGMGEQPLNKGDVCPFDESFSPSEEPPGKVIECALGWYRSTDAGFGSYFALLDDGTIWLWRHAHDVINASMTIIPLSVCIGLMVSTTIFITTMIIIRRYSKRKIEQY